MKPKIKLYSFAPAIPTKRNHNVTTKKKQERQAGAWAGTPVGRDQKRSLLEQIRTIENEIRYERNDPPKPKEVIAAEKIVATWEAKNEIKRKAAQKRTETMIRKARNGIHFAKTAEEAKRIADDLETSVS